MGKKNNDELQYGIDDVPPWYTTILLAFQHYLTMFGATVTLPLVITPLICMHDEVSRSEVISTTFFVSGLSTVLQSTIGIRLPIIQGGTFVVLSPIMAIMSLPQWECPAADLDEANDTFAYNATSNTSMAPTTFPEPDNRDVWQLRMREVQGAIILSSLVQVIVGFSGIMGPLLRFIGPLTIAPTITLIGLSLFKSATDFCSKQWGVAFLTMSLVILFSQYLRNVDFPCGQYVKGKGCKKIKAPIFKLFPVILAILLSWFICFILTVAGAFPDDPKKAAYDARTDSKLYVLRDAKWIDVPYPGQWGAPTFSVASVLGMMAAIVAGMIESIGDYYACARLAGAPPPPTHAINRGVFMEGVGCIIAGLFGTGSGTTSYSENIGAIGITKVGSRRVIQVGGCIMLILGLLGKFGALFVTIPDPVVGGVFMIMFGMITAVGVSNLQFVDLNSSRNLFVFGFSTLAGFSIPLWIASKPGVIDTGAVLLDQILTVLLTTSMFVGGCLGCFLDNTIPGTAKERGVDVWTAQSKPQNNKKRCDSGEDLVTPAANADSANINTEKDGIESTEIHETDDEDNDNVTRETEAEPEVKDGPYDFPFGMNIVRKLTWTKYIPISPTFEGYCRCRKQQKSYDVEMEERGVAV